MGSLLPLPKAAQSSGVSAFLKGDAEKSFVQHCSDPSAARPAQGSVYQKTNAMSEIKRVNKDHFWAKAEVRAAEQHCGPRGGAQRG